MFTSDKRFREMTYNFAIGTQTSNHIAQDIAKTQTISVFRFKFITDSLTISQFSVFAMSSNVLADKDVNATAAQQAPATLKGDVRTMEYHRQMLQSKLDEEKYVALSALSSMTNIANIPSEASSNTSLRRTPS